MFGHGTPALPSPYNVGAHDTVTGGRYDNNCLDNKPGKTYDNVILNNGVTDWMVGGPNAGDGNEASGNGDILVSCLSCGQDVGHVTVQGNTVTNGSLGGVRLTGDVHNVSVLNNMLVNDQGIAVVVAGRVTTALIQGNTMTRQLAAGVGLLTNSVTPGIATGITITGNTIAMGNNNKPTVWLANASTDVKVTVNAYDGGHDDTAQAGAGLVVRGNH